jgi:hypothetical protein
MIKGPMEQNVLRLRPWDEACGVLQRIVENGPCILLELGKLQVQISSTEFTSIQDQLKSMIGKRISLLKTDMHDRPLLMRIIGDE